MDQIQIFNNWRFLEIKNQKGAQYIFCIFLTENINLQVRHQLENLYNYEQIYVITHKLANNLFTVSVVHFST